MAYYAAIKMKKLLMYATKWMNLRNIMPVDTKCNLFILKISRKYKPIETGSRLLLPWSGLGAGTDPQEDTRVMDLF